MNDRFGAFRGALSAFLPQAEELKAQLNADGWSLTGDEPLKLTLCPKSRGYTGIEVARHLESLGIFPEFYDPDLVVLMLSPYCGRPELDRLRQALTRLPPRPAVTALPPPLPHPVRVLSPREALCRPAERLPLADCEGRISAAAALSCPPPSRSPSAVNGSTGRCCAACATMGPRPAPFCASPIRKAVPFRRKGLDISGGSGIMKCGARECGARKPSASRS